MFKFKGLSEMGIGRFVVFLLFFSLFTLCSLSFVVGAEHNVTGSTFNDINSTIAGSASGDTILLGNKTYTSVGDYIR